MCTANVDFLFDMNECMALLYYARTRTRSDKSAIIIQRTLTTLKFLLMMTRVQ